MKKNQPKKVIKKKQAPKDKKERFFEAIGRRKTSTARVRIYSSTGGEISINDKPFSVYFPKSDLQQMIKDVLQKTDTQNKFKILVKVKGGGFRSQAEAVRHGIARSLILFNPELRKVLKKSGFLTRDPRMRERKKFGLRRARRARQWRKR